MEPRINRLGLGLFGAYAAVYGVFVFLNAVFPQSMSAVVAGGLNLAVAYGCGLIGLAIVMAVLYGLLKRDDPSVESRPEDGQP